MEPGSVLKPDELASQAVELLPARETLCFDIVVAPVIAVNLSFAINAATIGSSATAVANQAVFSLPVG